MTEFYLYRRVMEALDYFKSGVDPFVASKQKGLESAFASMEALAPKVLATVEQNFVADGSGSFAGSLGADGANQFPTDQLDVGLRLFTLISLWGNRMDLSLWPAGSDGNVADAFQEVLAAGEANLLCDHQKDLLAVCVEAKASGGRRVDIVVDNAGFELVTDLCLADFLVSSGVASEVVFQLKAHPTFVSDALAKDLRQHVTTLRGLKDDGKFPGCAALGDRWQNMLADRRWRLNEVRRTTIFFVILPRGSVGQFLMSSFVESPSRSITLTLTFTHSLSLSLYCRISSGCSPFRSGSSHRTYERTSARIRHSSLRREMPTTDASSGTAAGRSTRPSRTSADTSRRPSAPSALSRPSLGVVWLRTRPHAPRRPTTSGRSMESLALSRSRLRVFRSSAYRRGGGC